MLTELDTENKVPREHQALGGRGGNLIGDHRVLVQLLDNARILQRLLFFLK